MWTCAGVLALVACACAVTRDQFYPHGHGLDQVLPRGSEVPSPELPLKVPVRFYGESYESVFINNFGVLSFRADIPSFLNIEFPLPYPSIAALYTNIDTTKEGAVYYRETDEPHVLSKAEESVQNNFHEYYDFKPTSVFIATWVDVTYTSNQLNTPRNSFQIALISNGTESFAEFLYPDRDIQWYQKESQIMSLPDAKAQAGFISEDGRIYALRGSGSHQIRNIVSWSNTHEPGKYVFRIGEIPLEGNVAAPDQYNQNEVEIEEESKTCAQSGPSVCHTEAKCVDYPAGICCQCKDGYYGNGKSCIKNDIPLRVHGKINGVLNNVNLNDVDIQAYVVVGEGRAYTALSLVPGGLGNSLQLLNVLGGVIGWLFAQPAGSAKNGYQLTGSLFNHTADVWFPASGDRVMINQEYLGHDVFDQITLETDVRGSIPMVLEGTKLEITDFDEQYTIVEPGLIRSESSRTFTNKMTGDKIEQRVSQTFTFSACRFAPASPENATPLTLKINKNYLGYETRQNIVRYGMTNKIFPLGQEDPCIKGRSSCSPHSTCVAKGDSFTCICQSGFTSIYQEEVLACIDIDECVAGIHNCDHNADCYNHAGGFQCRCRAGFSGNGINCNPLSTCHTKRCDTNAQCIENPGREATCVCNSGYYGDGQFCLPPNESPTNNEAEYNESFVLPQCNWYSCTCPAGYSKYRDSSNNQLCRLNSYDAPPQQTLDSSYQERTEPPYHPPTEPYHQPQTERPYSPTVASPYQSSEPSYPAPWESNYQQNNDQNSDQQNNYNQNSDNNYPPTNFDQNSDNNYQQNNYDPNSENNNDQNSENNNDQNSENNNDQNSENNYGPNSESNYQQNNDDSNSEDNNDPNSENNNDQNSENNNDQNSENNYNPNSESNYQQNNYDSNSENNNDPNSENNYQQNNYDQNSDNNYQYPYESNSQQSPGNNYQIPAENNQQSAENNYQQSSGNSYSPSSQSNSQQPPESSYQKPYDNNQEGENGYPSSEKNYEQQSESNYHRTSDSSYEQPPPTDYQPSYPQTSSGNEYQQPTDDPLIRCEEDAECPPNAVCSYLSPDGTNDGQGKHCVCPEGYEGDAFECIERTGPNCECGVSAHCVSTRGDEYICVCDPGYHGDGYVCRPNFSCKNNSDCEYNAECRPDPKSTEYMCQCIKGFIKDQNDACIPDAQLCNGASCAEHASCLFDDELLLNYCHCDEGYSGDAISQCVLAGHTCEVTNDCSINAICTPVDNSYQCICRDGFSGDGYNCIPEATCRYDPNMCDLHASCLKRHDVYVCECNAGYNGNGSVCNLNPRQSGNFLVASDGASVYKVPFRVTPRDFATPINSGISQIAVGIEVDCEAGNIYWSDVVSLAIKTSRYDGSGATMFLADGLKSPEGIAIDWSARNIFWTDSRKLTIEVANLDTKARKVLFAIDRISNPRGIAVHPQRGKIFWSDWKRTDPKIEWASMDGSQRGIFLDKSDVALPNSLAIDWVRDRLCYADAGLFSIKCVSIDTLEKETIATNCSYPFGLAIHGNKFYWTDWKTLKIESVDVETQIRGQVPIATASRRLYGVAVAPDQCPQVHSVCMSRNGGCGSNQLCLPDGNNGRTCVDADLTFSKRRR